MDFFIIILGGIGILAFFMYRFKEGELKAKEDKQRGAKRKEDSNPLESQNDTNRLLQQIEANTAKTAFWTKVVGVPVLIGIIMGALTLMNEC